MTILAIETTGTTCGVCIMNQTALGLFTLVSLHEVYQENVHDEMLAELVQHALASAGVGIESVDVVAVSGGPGSFTGTRIGVSFAKGLCFAGTPKLMVVDTLHVLAEAAREVAGACNLSVITVVIPSHRDLLYTGRYQVDSSSGRIARSPDEVTMESVGEARTRSDRGLVCGPGASLLADEPISGLTRLSSRFVALRASREITNGAAVYVDAQTATPLYRQEFTGRH